MGCTYCALEGTKVYTTEGIRNIEDVETGDFVFARDLSSGKILPDKVRSTMERTVKKILEIKLEDGTELNLTGEHPVYVEGFGWKLAKDLQEGDDLNISKRPDQSFKFSSSENPMKDPKVAKRMSKSLKQRWASGELESLRKKLRSAARKNIIKYNKKKSTRRKASERMKADNPMKDPAVSAQAAKVLKEGYASGRLTPYWQGKKKPDAKRRMETNNPMKDPEIRRKTLRKIVRSWVRNGKVSIGERRIKRTLSKMGLNFIHQAVVPGPDKDFVLDFLLPDHMVCIEYDGHSRHYTRKGHKFDRNRDKWIRQTMNIRTIRIHRDHAFITMGELKESLKEKIGI
jgi:intein/homing endonuclease